MLQDNLFDHLLRFRCYPIGITGYIAKINCHVAPNKEDKDYHRILWRDVPEEPIEIYRMTRVTFGLPAVAITLYNHSLKQASIVL